MRNPTFHEVKRCLYSVYYDPDILLVVGYDKSPIGIDDDWCFTANRMHMVG